MKKFLAAIGILILASALFEALGITSSNKKEPTTTTYESEEAFETDLNDDYDLSNVTVTFRVKEIREKSIKGYNLWAGEHLNFLPDKKPDSISVGDKVTVKTSKVKKSAGSWFINCEILSIESGSKSNIAENPAATDEATPTATAVPTEVAEITQAADTPFVPTNSPAPTTAPTDTPTPSSTPVPTDTPTPTNTPVPTNTPAPTNIPVPTSTPTPTPEPTATPKPTKTPTPTPKPSLDYTSNTPEKAKEGKTGYYSYVSDDADSVKEYLFVDFDDGSVCIVDYDTKQKSESFGFYLKLVSGNLNSGVKADGYTEAGNFNFTIKFKNKNDPSRIVCSNAEGFYQEYIPTNYDKALDQIQDVDVYDVSDPKHSAKNTPTPTPSKSGGSREVYITRTGECYHFKSSCVRNPIPVSLDDAKAMGYRPCSKCAY